MKKVNLILSLALAGVVVVAAIVLNEAVVMAQEPEAGNAIRLDGDGDYVDCGNGPSLQLSTALTLETWFRRDQLGSIQWLVCKYEDWDGQGSYGMYFLGDQINFPLSNSGNHEYQLGSHSIVADNNWHHVACTWDGTNAKIYIDGVLDAEGTTPFSSIFNSDRTVKIGYKVTPPEAFSGWIDEVRIWNVARTQAEIVATMNTTLIGNEPGLIGYWQFNESAGSPMAYDASPNGNHGTLYGNATFFPSGIFDTAVIWYVSTSGDNNNTGSKDYPFRNIWRGLEAALAGDTVYVMAGWYDEGADLKSDVVLMGQGADVTTIWGNVFATSKTNATIMGFTITDDNTAGLHIRGSTVTVTNCIVRDQPHSGICCWENSTMVVINNTVVNCGHSAISQDNSNLTLYNNIIVNNNDGVWVGGTSSILIDYNNVWGNVYDYSGDVSAGAHDISANPLFVNSLNDFHLQLGSPCIDAGDPDPVYNDKNGTRNDMGAYGGPDGQSYIYVEPVIINNKVMPVVQNVIWNPVTKIFAYDVALQNISSEALLPPMRVEINNLYPPAPTITINNSDGGGNGIGAYWDYINSLGPDNELSPGETSTAKRWEFYNPNMVGFYFSCDIYGVPASSLPKIATGNGNLPFAMTNDIKQQLVTINRGEINMAEIAVPKEFVLEQSYPNPFNAETVIKYQLPEPSTVSLKILNLLGQEIRTLIDGQKGAGYHEAIWDGRDNSGKDVASGIYIYRIQAGDFVDMKKMELIR